MSERPNRQPHSDPSPWPLWLAGLAAVAIGAAAFLLWGFDGAGYLFDMVLAFCA